MMITYIRTAPMPRCRSCGKQMEYYIPGLADDDHEHPKCFGARMAQELMRAFDADKKAIAVKSKTKLAAWRKQG